MAEKVEAIARGIGCGYVAEPWARQALADGRLVTRRPQRTPQQGPLSYAWRCPMGPRGTRKPPGGLALQWWLAQLASAKTRQALLGAAH
jgi:DNA-binding transcriptional LysR family regulator